MVTKEQIERINALYKKKNEVGLTDEEKIEQDKLRRLYINSFKENLKSQLDNIKIVSPEEYDKIKNENKHADGHRHNGNCDCGHEHKPKLKH